MTDDPEPSDGGDPSAEETSEGGRTPDRGPSAKLRASLTDFKNDLQDRVRGLVRAKKAAEQLCRTGALENLDLVQKYTDRLRDADLSSIAMEDRREGAVASLEQFVDRRRQKRRVRFMQTLHERADASDLAFEKLADTPLTLYLEPLTVEVDFETARVDLSYARETLEETDLDPDAVLEAHRSAVDALTDRAIPSEPFFDRLQFAYDMARRARGDAPGDRVDLVDLLTPLTVLSSDAEAWSSADLSELPPYPRPLLAYQIAKLRRDGLLAQNGRRLDLGTATGGSTDDKQQVLFIPSGRGEGQYYLSIRFTDED